MPDSWFVLIFPKEVSGISPMPLLPVFSKRVEAVSEIVIAEKVTYASFPLLYFETSIIFEAVAVLEFKLPGSSLTMPTSSTE